MIQHEHLDFRSRAILCLLCHTIFLSWDGSWRPAVLQLWMGVSAPTICILYIYIYTHRNIIEYHGISWDIMGYIYIRNTMIWGFGETWVDLEVLPLKCPSGAGLDVHGDECKTRTSQIVIHLENTWHHTWHPHTTSPRIVVNRGTHSQRWLTSGENLWFHMFPVLFRSGMLTLLRLGKDSVS